MSMSKSMVLVASAMLVGVLAGTRAPVSAQEAKPAAPAAYKIGVVDRELILKQYKPFKDKIDSLAAQKDAAQKDLDAKTDAWGKEREALDKQRGSLTPDQLDDRMAELERKLRQIRTDLETRQSDIDRQMVRILSDARTQIDGAVKSYAEAGQFHIILRADSPSPLAYYTPAIDVTPAVMARLTAK